MAYWDKEKDEIVYTSPKPYMDYPNWEMIDCGCCCGIQWGGQQPNECPDCEGSGYIARHIKSRALALYPGAPFLGKEPK